MLGLQEKQTTQSKYGFKSTMTILVLVLFALVYHGSSVTNFNSESLSTILSSSETDGICPIHDIIRPASFAKDNSTILTILYDEDFREKSASKLSAAVQVDTSVYDHQPNVPDAPELWAHFEKFHVYLKKTFPTVFETLEFETVNTYGIVLTWNGKNPSLKPSLYLAHQDVVPIQEATLPDWTYPPFDGKYDGEKLWGRGSSDCKNLLVGLMETVELLISKGFTPERTLILSFGFDEEASGIVGAHYLGVHLEEKWGKDSIYSIIDEGTGFSEVNGQLFATIANAEKGYVDVLVELTTPGGHSSVPPDHTNIGIIGELATLIEADPYEPLFTQKNSVFEYFQCLAVHSDMEPSLKKNILRSGYDKVANSKVIKYLTQELTYKFLIRTSQAMDIINGGAKVNALPEHTSLIINHRIAVEETVQTVKDRTLERALKVAKKHGLGIISWGKEILPPTEQGTLVLSSYGDYELEAAPVSPTNDNVFKYIAGTTRHVFEDVVFQGTNPIPLAPIVSSGNTDTRHYWNLTRNIYRYTPISQDFKASHVHSVDENIEFDTHLHIIAFFYEYIQNIDSADADN